MKKNVLILIIILIIATGIVAVLMKQRSDVDNNSPLSNPSSTNESYTAKQVAQHSTQNDCWTIIRNGVYNITAYVPQHPGGVSEIVKICGQDGTSLFEGNREHDATADTQLARLKIGTLTQ